jgi:hypothetical protein
VAGFGTKALQDFLPARVVCSVIIEGIDQLTDCGIRVNFGPTVAFQHDYPQPLLKREA